MFRAINTSKLLSPDFFLGKALLFCRALLDSTLLLLRRPSGHNLRIIQLILRVTPNYTMVSPGRLWQLYELMHCVNTLGLPGDVVECGTWNGGSATVLAVACRDDGSFERRTFWLFDSFEGLPSPGEQDGTKAHREFFPTWCRGDPRKVREILAIVGIPSVRVHIVPGWFETTLKAASIPTIALLHVDADWYESVMIVLETLYDRVVPGGFIVFDDYNMWLGCHAAVDRFLASRGLDNRLLTRGMNTSAYIRKPAGSNKEVQ